MRFVWTSAWKDLLRLRRDPTTIIIWMGIPTFLALILTLIFGRGPTRPHGIVLVDDEENSIASRFLASSFSQGALGEMLTVQKVKREDGLLRMDKGEASAMLVIPSGFSQAVFENRPVQLELIRNPSQTIVPGIVQETVSMMADGAFYLQAIGGDEVRQMSSPQVPTDAMVAASAVQMNRLIARLRTYLDPPLIQLHTEVIQEADEGPGAFATLLFPSMLYMAVFFVAGGLATDVWRERTAGSLRRVATTPVSLTAFLAGKLVAASIVLAGTGAIGLVMAHFLIDLPVASFLVADVWIALTGCGLYLLLMLLLSLASSERVANLLSNFVMLPLAMLGGSFFPFESMPKGLATVGRYTPNGWSLVHLKQVLAGTQAPPGWLIVATFVVAAWAAVQWRIRRAPC